MTTQNARRFARSVAAARRGFTLIEVMIVILIVLALGGLVAYNLLGTKEDAENKLCKIDMNTLEQALKQFRFDHGRYPTDDEGLEVLWNKEKLQDEEEAKKWRKLLEQPMAKDRFGNEWGYRQVSEHGEEDKYDIWSYGRDNRKAPPTTSTRGRLRKALPAAAHPRHLPRAAAPQAVAAATDNGGRRRAPSNSAIASSQAFWYLSSSPAPAGFMAAWRW